MLGEIEKLLEAYRAWLKDRTRLRQVNDDWIEVTTPYLDRHNDAVQIYARRENGGYLLTDDSYTIHDLEASGCNLQTEKRQELLNITLNGFGVRLRDDALQVYASAETFGARKHSLIQAILAINDLFYLAKPMIESLFYEDVVAWLDANDVRYTPGVKFTGQSGYDHHFDFVIPKSRRRPERILQTVNRPSRETAQALIYTWTDTRAVRPVNARAYALLNDAEQAIPAGVTEAFVRYEIRPVGWSERGEVLSELAA